MSTGKSASVGKLKKTSIARGSPSYTKLEEKAGPTKKEDNKTGGGSARGEEKTKEKTKIGYSKSTAR